MSSPNHDANMEGLEEPEDEVMNDAAEEEGVGDDAKAVTDDSSEEGEEDEEAERKVREGFIVDDEEEEEEQDEEEHRRKRKKRRKHKHRKRDEDEEEALDEDDLELLEENTGGRVGRSKLTRLRRGRNSDSPERYSSKRRAAVESSDDDLDQNNIIRPSQPQDIEGIWDDDRGGREDDEDMDMDDFIDDEEDDEVGAGAMAEEEREERRRERRKLEQERRKALRSRPELVGIDANAWDEIQDVFGDGHDYDWALNMDDEDGMADETVKSEMKYQDVFEPAAIKDRMLTEDDDLIRAQDYPERMQLATSTLSHSLTLAFPEPFTQRECMEAAAWITPRLSGDKERNFFRSDGRHHDLLQDLVSAVTKVVEYLFVMHFEVPYIYIHRRDYITHFKPHDSRSRVDLLTQDDLWRVYTLGQKYRSLVQRQNALRATCERINLTDSYFEDYIRPRMESVEFVADATHWLGVMYKSQKKDQFELRFHDDEAQAKKRKLPSRISAYEVAKKSIVSKCAEKYGIKSHEVVVNFLAKSSHFVEDPDLPPLACAEEFVDPDPSKALPAEELLRQARLIVSTELGVDPILRQEIRALFKQHAQLSVLPTDRGKVKIDEFHQFHNFKYLLNKSIGEMLDSIQFPSMLLAESQHLITIDIHLPNDVLQRFQNRLVEAFLSDGFSDAAKAWNEERTLAIQGAIEKHLIPAGIKWTREYIREEVEDFLAKRCGDIFYERLNAAPYLPPATVAEQSNVLAVSWGKGDPKKDEVNIVFLDDQGRLRDHTVLDNLNDPEPKEEFLEIMRRRKPDVIVVGGFSIQTTKLVHQIKEALGLNPQNPEATWEEPQERNEPVFEVPIIYVNDDVARIYQHSNRAAEEFSALPQISRYCVGLARYTHSPLLEFAALGSDLTAINFDEQAQPYVPPEKLFFALERALVNVVNKVGVDINRAVNESYYAHVLPYVAGLGPRKAMLLIKKIASMGGHLTNREQFIKAGILTTRIFLNAAGFLRIRQDPDYKEPKNRNGPHADYSGSPDPLDDTRIHPEDYELARKMATDALELDEEDVTDEHPSHVVSLIMKDPDNVKKLDELNLDDFAINMYETNNDRKRHTLNVIRAELLNPFAEMRPKFIIPDSWEVLTMLTGETRRTLRRGLIVSVLVVRIKSTHVVVKLDSGLEGVINSRYLADQEAVNPDNVVKKGQTIPGVIIDVKEDPLNDTTHAFELSSRPTDVQAGDSPIRRVKPDEHWDSGQASRDFEFQQRKKRAEINRAPRVIKHPNFHNFNSTQAESYLDQQHPGDVVIRPSSKGTDHLAVTWKVADKLFQHIDVYERGANPSGGTGGTFIVEGKEFADLDELIVSHVQAMSKRVEELMAHEKFKKDEDELHNHITNFVAANPTKSVYGFALNRKRPGHFNLSFLAKKGSPIQTWPVKVAPEAYYLFETPASGVPELCDAFKVRYLHESQNLGGAAPGAKTPYGAGRMTPGRTPGHATPGRMSVRQAGAARTPNPYSHVSTPGSVHAATPSSFAAGTPWQGATGPISSHSFTPLPPQALGYQTPAYQRQQHNFPMQPPPQQPPSGGPVMHPGRQTMLQNAGASGGWTPGSAPRW